MAKTSTQIRQLHTRALSLRNALGKLAEEHDSARIADALGHAASAVDNLYTALIVQTNREGGKPPVISSGEEVYLTVNGAGQVEAQRNARPPVVLRTYDDFVRECGEARQVLCSSSMDFPEEHTSDPAVLQLCKDIRG